MKLPLCLVTFVTFFILALLSCAEFEPEKEWDNILGTLSSSSISSSVSEGVSSSSSSDVSSSSCGEETGCGSEGSSSSVSEGGSSSSSSIEYVLTCENLPQTGNVGKSISKPIVKCNEVQLEENNITWENSPDWQSPIAGVYDSIKAVAPESSMCKGNKAYCGQLTIEKHEGASVVGLKDTIIKGDNGEYSVKVTYSSLNPSTEQNVEYCINDCDNNSNWKTEQLFERLVIDNYEITARTQENDSLKAGPDSVLNVKITLCSGLTIEENQFCYEQNGKIGMLCGANRQEYNPATHFCHENELFPFCGANRQKYDPTEYSCKDSINVNGIYLKNPIKDNRDNNRKYEAVLIGNQVWMAENLNYDIGTGTMCYKGDSNCTIYGRYYTWDVAQTACPSGWRLPDSTYWKALVTYVENDETKEGGKCTNCAGKYLKADSGWSGNGNGTDTYGFSALPGGNSYLGNHNSIETYGYWWSSNEYNGDDCSNCAYYYYMQNNNNSVTRTYNGKIYYNSVRCVKDANNGGL